MHPEYVHSNLHDLLRFDTVIISIVILKTEGLQKVCLSILRIATRQQIVKNYDFFSHKIITYCNSESDFWIIKKTYYRDHFTITDTYWSIVAATGSSCDWEELATETYCS